MNKPGELWLPGIRHVPSPNAGFVAIAGGYEHRLGLSSDGSIVAWGFGPGDPPAPNADFVGIAAGQLHSLGLKADSTIVAWGWNQHGQCNIPAPNEGFAAVAGGGYHSLGLKSNGTVAAWGVNDSLQCTVPEPNAGFMAIAGGGDHSRQVTGRRGGFSASYLNNNRGKRSVTLNLKDPRGVEAALRLCETADVFVQNFRPGVMDGLGLGYEDIRAVNPDVVYAIVEAEDGREMHVRYPSFRTIAGGSFGPSTVTHYVLETAVTGISSLRFTLSQNLTGSFSGISGGPPGSGAMGLPAGRPVLLTKWVLVIPSRRACSFIRLAKVSSLPATCSASATVASFPD